MTSPSWDPRQYLRFESERARPWHDLTARLADLAPASVVDLGCGPGRLTATLSDRWPDAHVLGVDSSPAMIETAGALVRPGRLEFELGEIETWRPSRPVDLVISNAALQWVPTHLDLLRSWLTGALVPGGALALQVPANRDADASLVMRRVANSPRWADRLAAVSRGSGPGASNSSVREPIEYADALGSAGGVDVDVWETTYLHVLDGQDPVLQWFAGSGLRPYLDALADDPDAGAEFRADVAAGLREAYPRRPYGTVLPFRRIFALARTPKPA
jgi:trans-aconitate 2-methyltransferase